MLITACNTSASELRGNSSKMERSSLYHCRFLSNISCFYAAFCFASLVSDLLFYRLLRTNTTASVVKCRNLRKRQLTKKADPGGAEENHDYDLCPYIMALYGLLSQPVVPPGYWILYCISSPLHLSCLSSDGELGNEEEDRGVN